MPRVCATNTKPASRLEQLPMEQLQLNFIELGFEVGKMDWADGMMFQKLIEAIVLRMAIRQFMFIHH